MCHSFDSDPYHDEDDDGNEPGCSFVLYPEGMENEDEDDERWEVEEHKYCKVHKPTGAIKFCDF